MFVRVYGGVLQVFGVYFVQIFVLLDWVNLRQFFVVGQIVFVQQVVFFVGVSEFMWGVCLMQLEQWGLCQVDVVSVNDWMYELEQQGQQQGVDMSVVNVGVSYEDDFVVV